VLVTLVGLLVSLAISMSARAAAERSDQRLLRLKTAEAGAVLQQAVHQVQTELASAAEFTSGSTIADQAFAQYVQPFVGGSQGFSSASLWRVRPQTRPELLRVVGARPRLAQDAGQAADFFAGAVKTHRVSVHGMLDGPDRSLGYAYAVNAPSPEYVVYAESRLPAGGRVTVPENGPFSDLRFALYLGRQTRPDALLETNVPQVKGSRATTVIPFGDQSLTLVAASAGPLVGAWNAALWWLMLTVGVVLSLSAGVFTERLSRDRHAAERSAVALADLFEQQRSVSATLQQAMVPPVPPPVPDLEIAVRYLSGSSGLEIGGDWYDVIDLGGGRTFLSIGDVAGRGVVAGALMASLRSAVRAFVSEGHPPAEVLNRLAQLSYPMPGSRFATLLVGVLDLPGRQLRLACAGHLPPLLLTGYEASYVEVAPGPPVGALPPSRPYLERTVSLPPRGGLLLFTDGLVERRDEDLELSLERLRGTASQPAGTADELVCRVTSLLHDRGARDDTAVLALRW